MQIGKRYSGGFLFLQQAVVVRTGYEDGNQDFLAETGENISQICNDLILLKE